MTRADIRWGYVVCNGTREFPVRVNSPNSYVLLDTLSIFTRDIESS
jgi:hypothetical protein